LENWFKIEFIATYRLRISPLELDEMEFYRIEYMLQNYEETLDEEEKRYKKQEIEQKKQYQQSNPQMKDFKPQNFGGFKTPKIEMPKINIPKF
jgi:hypothetical protein